MRDERENTFELMKNWGDGLLWKCDFEKERRGVLVGDVNLYSDKRESWMIMIMIMMMICSGLEF